MEGSTSDSDELDLNPKEVRLKVARERRLRRKATWARNKRRKLADAIPKIADSEEELMKTCPSVETSDVGLSDEVEEAEIILSDLEDHLKLRSGSLNSDDNITLQESPNYEHILTSHNASSSTNDGVAGELLVITNDVDIPQDQYDSSDEEIIAKLEEEEDKEFWRESSRYSDDEAENFMMKPDRNAPGTLWDSLRSFHFKYKLPREATTELLHILDNHGVNRYHQLPLHCRTLTSIEGNPNYDIRNKSGVEYFYLGVENQLRHVLKRYPLEVREEVDHICVSQNIDGLQLFKSSGVTAWPLLMRVQNLKPATVFPVVVSVGAKKPTDLEYLEAAIDDLAELLRTGIEVEGKVYEVKLGPVICDSPARAFAKNVISYNAMYGCDQCTSCGMYDGKRMTWPRTWDLQLRTDESFRLRQQPQYHKGRSVFEKIPLDMIQDFPVDFMHQCGGAIRKIISWNVEGPRRAGAGRLRCRMSTSNVRKCDNRIKAIQSLIPNCFARKARGTNELKRYKYTELRQLLLYSSKIVFDGLMATSSHYEHLIGLNIACSILVDESLLPHYLDLAEALLKSFANGCIHLYGSAFMVYNVHAMLHLPLVAKRFGALDNVSAWPFESFLGTLKKHVKSGIRPIVSLKRGCLEQNACHEGKHDLIENTSIIYTTRPNNTYIDMNKKECYDITEICPGRYVKVDKYLDPQPYFSKPVSSDLIGCFKVKRGHKAYLTLSLKYAKSLRRAMRIDLDLLPGFPDDEVSVIMGLFHENTVKHSV